MTQGFSTINQTIAPVKGMYALIPNIPHGHDYIFYSAEVTDTLNAGDFVKLRANASVVDNPQIEACEVTDVPFGMVVYNVRNGGVYNVGDKVAIAESGNQVWLVAESAITSGSKLQFTTTGTVAATTTESNAFCGIALTSAAAKGDFVKVQLDFNLGTQPAGE